MGSGASAESARTTVAHMLTGKPADASDIKVIFYWIQSFSRIEGISSYYYCYEIRIWSKQEQRFVIYVVSHGISKINCEVRSFAITIC